jgi:hypothetical protein
MLIEFIKNKELEGLEIGKSYRTRSDRPVRLLSPDKIIRILNINAYNEVTYIYPDAINDTLRGTFHRTRKELEREVILEPVE